VTTILVQMAEPQWTKEALHLACAMARNTNSNVTLLRLIEAQYYSWLGTSYGVETFSPDESASLWDYKTIAEKYGVELCVQPMQYVTFGGALVDASDELNANVVFARIPASAIPFWHKYQSWDLHRQFEQRERTLYTLDQPVQSLSFALQQA